MIKIKTTTKTRDVVSVYRRSSAWQNGFEHNIILGTIGTYFTIKYYTQFLLASYRFHRYNIIIIPAHCLLLLYGPEGRESDLRRTGRRRRSQPEDVSWCAHVTIWTAEVAGGFIILLLYYYDVLWTIYIKRHASIRNVCLSRETKLWSAESSTLYNIIIIQCIILYLLLLLSSSLHIILLL